MDKKVFVFCSTTCVHSVLGCLLTLTRNTEIISNRLMISWTSFGSVVATMISYWNVMSN